MIQSAALEDGGAVSEQIASTRFAAFISYARADETWAIWAQRAIERYQAPRRLVGRESAQGPTPKRLGLVFRDKSDLEAAGDLGERLKSALRESAFLIVICSPAARASRWVDEEIRHFRALGRGDRIIALLVDGAPTSEGPEAAFPKALSELGEASGEPLAADAREAAGGASNARLQILARMLGLRLTDFTQRELEEERRRRRRAAGLAAIATTLATAAVLGGAVAYAQYLIATEQRKRIEAAHLTATAVDLVARIDREEPVELDEAIAVSAFLRRASTLSPADAQRDVAARLAPHLPVAELRADADLTALAAEGGDGAGGALLGVADGRVIRIGAGPEADLSLVEIGRMGAPVVALAEHPGGFALAGDAHGGVTAFDLTGGAAPTPIVAPLDAAARAKALEDRPTHQDLVMRGAAPPQTRSEWRAYGMDLSREGGILREGSAVGIEILAPSAPPVAAPEHSAFLDALAGRAFRGLSFGREAAPPPGRGCLAASDRLSWIALACRGADGVLTWRREDLGQIGDTALSPSGLRVAAAHRDGVKLIDADGAATIPAPWPRDLAWLDDERLLLFGRGETHVATIGGKSAAPLLTAEEEPSDVAGVIAVRPSPDRRHALLITRGGAVYQWSAETPENAQTVEVERQEDRREISFDPGRGAVSTWSDDSALWALAFPREKTVRIGVAGSDQIARAYEVSGATHSLRFVRGPSPRLVIGDDEGRIEEIDLASGRRRLLDLGPRGGARAVWSQSGDRVLFETADRQRIHPETYRRPRRAFLRDERSGERVEARMDAPTLYAAFAGEDLLTIDERGAARLWRPRSGRRLIPQAEGTRRAEWSPDGAWLALVDGAGGVAIWDPAADRLIDLRPDEGFGPLFPNEIGRSSDLYWLEGGGFMQAAGPRLMVVAGGLSAAPGVGADYREFLVRSLDDIIGVNRMRNIAPPTEGEPLLRESGSQPWQSSRARPSYAWRAPETEGAPGTAVVEAVAETPFGPSSGEPRSFALETLVEPSCWAAPKSLSSVAFCLGEEIVLVSGDGSRRSIPAPIAKPQRLAFSPRADRLAVANERGRLAIIDAAEGRVITERTLPAAADALGWTPDGGRALVLRYDGDAAAYPAEPLPSTLEILCARLATPPPNAVAEAMLGRGAVAEAPACRAGMESAAAAAPAAQPPSVQTVR